MRKSALFRRYRFGTMVLASASAASLTMLKDANAGIAVNFDHILYATSGTSDYTAGFKFYPADPSGMTINSFDFALQTLPSVEVRLFSINTSTNVVTQLASATVTTADTPTLVGGAYGNSNSNNAGNVTWYQHTLATPVSLVQAPNIVYGIVGDIPKGTNIYENQIVSIVVDPAVGLVGGTTGAISNRTANGYVADPTGNYLGVTYGYFDVNMGVSLGASGGGTNNSGGSVLTWVNASGNNTWDTTSLNFNGATGNPVAYNDTSNTALSTGDTVSFTDANGGGAAYHVTISSVLHPTSITVNNSAGDYTFSGAGGISGPGGLNKSGTSALTLSTSNTYTGGTSVTGGTLILAAAGALPAGTNLTIASGATVIASNLGSTTALSVGSLAVAGKLDLNNNALIVRNSSVGAVTAMATSGYGSGSWNGPSGIVSSAAAGDTTRLTALGVIQNSTNGSPAGSALYATFEGKSSSNSDVLVKYTYYGDANLDGVVDGSDYSRIDAAFLSEQSGPAVGGWFNGDFNYDGVVNGSDYTLIDNAFNSQGAQLTSELATPNAQIAGAAVPEPTTLGLLGIGAFGLLGRRKANRRPE